MENFINNIQEIPKDKKVFVFDLDGTLAESKTKIDSEMGTLLARLLIKSKIAIIGGASFGQMKSQLPENISEDSNLMLLPLDGGSLYLYQDEGWPGSRTSGGSAGSEIPEVSLPGWRKIYSQSLTDEEKKKIFESFEKAFKDTGYVQSAKIYGEIIEDRGGQVTFSALGQHAPLDEKEKWNKENNEIRFRIVAVLKDYLPDMEIKVAGLTSIDVTRKGIDKKFGIKQIIKHLGVTTEDVLFFGDALEPEGNDYPALEAGVACYKVSSVQDTKEAIEFLLD